MKRTIVMLMPINNRTIRFIKDGLEKLGHKVIQHIQADSRTLRNTIKAHNPDMILFSKEPKIYKDLELMKRIYPNIKYVNWNVDTRHKLEEWSKGHLSVLSLADYMFTVSNTDVKLYQTMFPKMKAFHLLQGIFPAVNNTIEPTLADKALYTCDVLFAGETNHKNHKNRKPLLNQIRAAGINVLQIGQEKKVINENLSRAIQCTKICLDINTWSSASGYASVRVYEVMGARGFLLGPSYTDPQLIFGNEPNHGTYTTNEDCIDKIKYYLSNDEERLRIAQKGYDYVHTYCTYQQRVEKMLEIVFKPL